MCRLGFLALMAIWSASACTSYRVQALSPALDGQKVRVSVRDTVGRQPYVSVDVKDFWHRDDAVGGLRCRKEDPVRPYCTWEAWSVRRELVVGLRVKKYDGKKTGRAAVAGVFLAGAMLGTIAGAELNAPDIAADFVGEMGQGAVLSLRAMCDHDPSCGGQRPAFFEVFWISLPGTLCPLVLPVGEEARLPL